MDFLDTAEEATFRAQAREWLEAHAPSFAERNRELAPLSREALNLNQEWQACKYDAGWACLDWPKAHGGAGRGAMETILFSQEEARFQPPRHFLGIGLGTCASAIRHHGTDEQRERYLPKLARGDEVWCQLFSEPSAGSDLAGLRTKAIRDGDDWIVTGQKVWNTGAHYADWGVLVARFDPELPKHKGLVYFVVDMKSEGIEARPIRQIPGSAEFNEVFLNQVRIPDAQRIGEVGAGWQVAITTLMNERHGPSLIEPDVEQALELSRGLELDGRPAIEDAAVRSQLADWYIQTMGIRHNHHRALTAISKGRKVGPEASISKVVRATERQEIASFGADLQELAGVLLEDSFDPQFTDGFLNAPRTRIAAGTDEILRNIIAERVLGLPGEIRVDRDRPFEEIPS